MPRNTSNRANLLFNLLKSMAMMTGGLSAIQSVKDHVFSSMPDGATGMLGATWSVANWRQQFALGMHHWQLGVPIMGQH